jgi:very-short-patch-repair endonuclease
VPFKNRSALNHLQINFGLIVINVIINLIVVLEMLLIIIGVHTILIENYVKMKIVLNVLINNLLHIQKVNFGVIKMYYVLDKCPFCKHKTELKLFELLKQQNYNVKKESSFIWSKNKRFDFILEELKLIIELNGAQHFKQISNWQSPEETQENDEFKNKLANKNGYRIIRICQEIVWNDTENCEIQLKVAINQNNKIIKIGNVFKNKK